jgi:hypothetical protein
VNYGSWDLQLVIITFVLTIESLVRSASQITQLKSQGLV